MLHRFRAARCRATTRETDDDAATHPPEVVVGIDLGTTNSVIAVGCTPDFTPDMVNPSSIRLLWTVSLLWSPTNMET